MIGVGYKNTEPSYFCGVGKVCISPPLIRGQPLLLPIKFDGDYGTVGSSKHVLQSKSSIKIQLGSLSKCWLP